MVEDESQAAGLEQKMPSGIVRQRLRRGPAREMRVDGKQFDLVVAHVRGEGDCGNTRVVTDVKYALEPTGQLYRDRSDGENVFELKNQWGLSALPRKTLTTARACSLVTTGGVGTVDGQPECVRGGYHESPLVAACSRHGGQSRGINHTATDPIHGKQHCVIADS